MLLNNEATGFKEICEILKHSARDEIKPIYKNEKLGKIKKNIMHQHLLKSTGLGFKTEKY